ncbi:MAG: methyltransferase [Pseudomonadota bacterium]
MTPRENFEAATNHHHPERVLVDMGKHIGSIHKRAYPALREYLGNVPMKNDALILDRMAQTVVPDEALLERLGIDFRWIVPHWVQVTERTDVPGYIDMWGVPYRRTDDGDHFAVDGAPLKKATLKDLDRFAWPDVDDPKQFEGLGERARHLYQTTGYVIGADAIKAGPLMSALQMRGYEQFFMDLVIDPEFADALLDRITSTLKQMWTRYLREVGPYVQIAYVTDDLGTQTSLLMSPQLFRERIKPRLKELHDHIKSLADVKLMMHTDGAVGPIIGDLCEINVDILNPVQTSTAGMGDTAALKARYGDHLTFHGAIDVQQLLPNANADELRWEVAKRIYDLGPGGGFIIAPCHNIGPDIPPANTVAFFDLVKELGRYPLQLDAEVAKNRSYFARQA